MNADDFCSAASKNDLAKMKAYLYEGGHVDDYNSNSWTALCAAVYNDSLEAVRFLIENGASPFLTSNDRTPRVWAQASCHARFVDLLQNAEQEYLVRTTPEWSLLGRSNLAHVSFSIPLRRKLTEIFNFESRQLLTTYENTVTGEEKLLPTISFDDLDEKVLEKNLDILHSLGGKANPDTVFKRTTFKKNTIPAIKK